MSSGGIFNFLLCFILPIYDLLEEVMLFAGSNNSEYFDFILGNSLYR
jgi:hypothetical protein